MKLIDLYTPMQNGDVPELPEFPGLARAWGINPTSLKTWFESADSISKQKLATDFLKFAPEAVDKVESIFKTKLPGALILMPSFGEFDGFARYDRGLHTVLLGIDFPDADLDYIKALSAHELSHVYRDHSPEVWKHLGKPLHEVSRKEYLDAGSHAEHLASEGLATLFSQHVYPEIDPRVHHFYEAHEWDWILKNHDAIDRAILDCLKSDQNVWSFYSSSRVARGSPGREHYYWAARKIAEMAVKDILALHALAAPHFQFG